jgi:hypothetical protein
MAVAQAIATFTRLGHDVAVPITESAPYDLIVDCDDGLKRVQVRYTSCSRGQVDLRRIHSNGSGYVVKKTKPDAYDWLYVLNDRGEEFLVKECLHTRRSWTASETSLLQRVAVEATRGGCRRLGSARGRDENDCGASR